MKYNWNHGAGCAIYYKIISKVSVYACLNVSMVIKVIFDCENWVVSYSLTGNQIWLHK